MTKRIKIKEFDLVYVYRQKLVGELIRICNVKDFIEETSYVRRNLAKADYPFVIYFPELSIDNDIESDGCYGFARREFRLATRDEILLYRLTHGVE